MTKGMKSETNKCKVNFEYLMELIQKDKTEELNKIKTKPVKCQLSRY